MAIKNYIRPRLEVYQLLEVTRQATGDHLAACIVGPTYDLYRSGVEDVADVAFEPATSSTFDLAIDTHIANHYELDVDSVQLDVTGLRALVSSTVTTGLIPSTSDPLTIRVNAASTGYLRVEDKAQSSKLCTALNGRNMEVGDIVYLSVATTASGTPDEIDDAAVSGNGDVAKYATIVTDLIPAAIDIPTTLAVEDGSDWSTVTDGTITTFAHAAEVTGSYAGNKATDYVIKLKKTDATTISYSITDSASVDTATNGTVTFATGTAVPIPVGTLGLSLSLTVQAADSATSVTVRVSAQAQDVSATLYDGVRLKSLPYTLAMYNDILSNYTTNGSAWNVKLRVATEYSGVLPQESELTGSNAWEVTPVVDEATGDILGSVTLAENIFLKVKKDYVTAGSDDYISAYFVSGIGTIQPSYRVLTYPVSSEEEMFTIYSTEDIQKHFGTIDILNPLAYGCQVALDGAAGREIFAIRTQGTSADAFSTAMKKTEATSDPYSFVPLSHDLAAINVVARFNQKMSEPEVKKWRRTIVGVNSMSNYELASVDLQGHPLKAVVLNNARYGNVMVQLSEDTDYNLEQIPLTGGVTTTLHEGDLVRFNDIDQAFEVDGVIDARTIGLKSGPSTTISTPKNITLIKASSSDNNIEYIGNYSANFGSRRVTTVWADNGYLIEDNSSKQIDNMYLACEVAGLSSSVVPQQSITRSQITSINSLPRMYTQYSQNELDKIAAQGVLIITQDAKGDYVYIRHALTTETDKGNLYYEDACTRNIDNISYAVVDTYEPYIGRANVTPTALLAIRRDMTNLLLERQSNSTDALIGPQVISWDGLEVYQDPTYLDCVVVKVNLYLPLPLNRIRVYEMAYIARVTIEEEA